MRNLRGTYVHMGDRVRRRRRVRRTLLALGLSVAGAGTWTTRLPAEAHAETAPLPGPENELRRLRTALDATRGELGAAKAQLDRWREIFGYSSRYHVGADLAASVYETALEEGLDPELGFRLVRVESQFNPRATSPVGAIGLTQVMPATARFFEKDITPQQLYDERTNLRIGFRYLRGLVREQKGDLRLALLVYNRGPVAVEASQRLGIDPSNGYDRAVMNGYTGRGITD